MNTKSINFFVSSLFLLMFGFAILVGQNIKPEQKTDFGEGENSGSTASQSGEMLIIDLAPKIVSGLLEL